MSDIAVIDIAGFLSGADLATAPKEVEAAASSIGFLQVVGHGIPAGPIDAVYDAMARLAALDPSAREHVLTGGHPYRGLHRNTDDTGAVRQERFLVSRFDDPLQAVEGGVDPAHADFFSPNLWPELDGFREAVTTLFGMTRGLARRMMGLFAVALGLPVDWFEPMIGIDASTFAANHYPPRPPAGDDCSTRVLFAEHADGNTLTLLHQRGTYNGLQIQPLDRGGEWIEIPVVDDAFVVNIGELMTRWTNDAWPSTRHRVMSSPRDGDARTTLTTFHMPSLDAVVAPLVVCGGDVAAHYEPVTPYQWERRFIKQGYGRQALTMGTKVQEFIEALPG
ncbi:MAG TPA: 2OG-Fe(II) oxygenase family protein [Acidimicrobiales bacterium]|nr:2OG-Fe(II) oxygenase family protein [Acidimicrobiales bacterium]